MERERLTNWKLDYASLAGPVVLILTGLLLVTGAALGFLSLAKIQSLWPIALMLIGLSELSPPSESQPQSGSGQPGTQEETARNARR